MGEILFWILWSLIKSGISWNWIGKIPLELLAFSVIYFALQISTCCCMTAGTFCSSVIQISSIFNIIVCYLAWTKTLSALLCFSTLWKRPERSRDLQYEIDNAWGWFSLPPWNRLKINSRTYFLLLRGMFLWCFSVTSRKTLIYDMIKFS